MTASTTGRNAESVERLAWILHNCYVWRSDLRDSVLFNNVVVERPRRRGGCLYVGMSATCVRRRLLDHLSSEENPELRRELELFGGEPTRIEFGTAWASDEGEARALESAVIEDWRPRTNRRG